MAAPYTAADVDYVLSRCQSAAFYIDAAGDNLQNAGIQTTWAGARNYVSNAAGCLQSASTFIYDGGGSSLGELLHNILEAIRANWPSGGAANMAAILSAMLAATPDELTNFIGIEQAYMAAMWNAPYNGEYYAALARGFRKWP